MDTPQRVCLTSVCTSSKTGSGSTRIALKEQCFTPPASAKYEVGQGNSMDRCSQPHKKTAMCWSGRDCNLD